MTTTLDWYGCATFAMRTAGLDILLDAYVDRAANAAGPNKRAEDVTACDWIVVGHAHFDHLYGAERIAPATGATIIGNYESIRLMAEAGVPEEQLVWVAGGETIDLGNDVKVHVYPSQHSCVWSHAGMGQPDEVCLGDLGVTWHQQRERFAELTGYLSTELDPAAIEHMGASMAGHSHRGDGGALVYLFETPDGTVLFQDTSGHWTGILERLRPDVAILAAAGRGNIDGEPIQGTLAEFVSRQVGLLEPRRVVLGHHDDWLPGFSVDTDVAPIRKQLEVDHPGVELLEPGYLDGTVILG
ncbi:MAG: MBL fold metallo-hydrolase [Actinomycetota bacterium]|nr:MBL fold metallo-hydrolase [Actinomycetota bacterium]